MYPADRMRIAKKILYVLDTTAGVLPVAPHNAYCNGFHYPVAR